MHRACRWLLPLVVLLAVPVVAEAQGPGSNRSSQRRPPREEPDSCEQKEWMKKKYAPTTTVDEFKGYTRVVSPFADLDGDAWLVEKMGLTFQQFTAKSGEVSYQVFFNYNSSSWIFIERGESLLFLIDGESVGLRGDGSLENREVLSGGKIFERAMYETDPALFQRLAGAKEVKVRIVGSKGYQNFTFGRRTFCVVSRFAFDMTGAAASE